MAAAAQLAHRVPQSDRLHRAVSADGIQLCHGGGVGPVVPAVRLETEEQEARKLPPAVLGVSRHLQSSPRTSLPEVRPLRRENGKILLIHDFHNA